MSRRFTNDEVIERITRGYAFWKQDLRGKAAGRGFTAHYLERRGRCYSIYRVINAGRLASILARCPKSVQRDWSYQPREFWTRERVIRTLLGLYAAWQTDARNGQPHGVRWSRAYILRTDGGRNLLRSADQEPIRLEVYLRQHGGPIFTDWHCHRFAWDAERMRLRVRTAHHRWERDAVFGKPAGKKFNYHYLAQHSGLWIVGIVRDHYRGGIHRFIYTVPEAAADWQRRRRWSHAEVRAAVKTFYRKWLHDPAGRAVCLPFGTSYFRRHRQESLLKYLYRNGAGRVLRGAAYARIRRSLGVRTSGFYSSDMRARRAAFRRESEAAHAW